MEQFKDQLNEYLESFTAKDAKAIVVACGEHNALDAWRQLAERGFSMRPHHIHDLMRLALFPRAAVQAKDLEVAIASWESDSTPMSRHPRRKSPSHSGGSIC